MNENGDSKACRVLMLIENLSFPWRTGACGIRQKRFSKRDTRCG